MAKAEINQFVHMKAKPDRVADVQRLLEALVEHTRAEDGPVAFDLFQSKADPTRFTIYEGWDSKEAVERHLKSAYFQDTVAKMRDLVAERDKDGTPFIGEPLTMLADRSDAA